MTPEALLGAGYAVALLAAALALEWLSAHTHRRSLRHRTGGFEYQAELDVWVCPEGEHLWAHELDHERRLVRYRARAQVCNRCPVKDLCTDSDDGREVVRPIDPWPHSEAGRFHRVMSLMLVVLATLVAVVALARNHGPAEAALLCALLGLCALAGRLLVRDLRAHPANFPEPAPSHGSRMTVTGGDGDRPRSGWASATRAGRRF
jgi:Transposase DDE domain